MKIKKINIGFIMFVIIIVNNGWLERMIVIVFKKLCYFILLFKINKKLMIFNK